MNEDNSGDSQAGSNGGERPPSHLPGSIIGAAVVLLILYLLLRPSWLQQMTGLPGGDPTLAGLRFWLGLLFVVVTLVLKAALEQGEAALAAMAPAKVASLKERKLRASRLLESLGADLDHSIRTARLGTLLLLVLGVIVGMWRLAPPAADTLQHWVRAIPRSEALGLAYLAVFILIMGAMAVLGDLVPRSLAAADPERYALKRAWLLRVTKILLGGPVVFGEWLAAKLCGLYRVKLYTPVQMVTEEQLRGLIEATEEGELEEEERHMIHSVFDFTDTVAREVMTPRTDMDAAPVQASLDEIAELVSSSGHSRIPVYEEDVDHIVGIVHAKDLLRHLNSKPQPAVTEIMRPVYLIPENKRIGELLSEFRTGRTQIAIVQDEYGGTAGLVTIEDIVEEIVGEIVDEYDEDEPMVIQLDEHSFVIDGRMNLDDVNDHVDSQLESEEFDSLGGYVFGLLGHQPAQGDVVEDCGWRFEVRETDGRRITKVLMRRMPETELGTATSSES